MDTILKHLEEPKFFESFVKDHMKNSTYVPLWKAEIDTIDYCSAKVYQANTAEYAAAVIGSVIDKNGEKPLHSMPTLAQLTGTIGHMGDEWQMDNDYLDQMYYLEGRYNDRFKGRNIPEQADAEFKKLLNYMFRPFEKAVIAPQKRIDLLYFEGLFNGTQTVSRANNTKSNVSYTFDLGIKKFTAKVAAWGQATATPIADIQQVVDYANSKGRTVQKIRMSRSTFRNMCKATEITNTFKLTLGKVQVGTGAPMISPAQMNEYLESQLLPTITVEPDRFATYANGGSVNMTVDNRVVFQCADKVAVLKIADALESVDPLPNKTYSTYDDNLVGYWRDKTGRHVDYDMWAQPVFVGKEDYFILNTDVTA